jgi:tetratricopeptide (TPR) repeat protein
LLLALISVSVGLVVWSSLRVDSRTRASPPQIAAAPDASPQTAKIHYQRGVYYWNLRTQDAFLKAIEEYKAAIQVDQRFAPAHAGLALVLAMQSGFKPPREVFPEARKYAEAAVKLDGNLADAHAALGFVRFYYDWDWEGAEDEFKRAIALSPSYASAHSHYAILLLVTNRFAEALNQARLAEQADPVSAAVATGLGRVYYWSGQYHEAIEQFQRVLSMHPEFPEAHLSMATALAASNNFDAAVRQISYVLSESLSSSAIADLAYMYARMGEKQLARGMLAKVESLRNENKRYVSPCHLAVAYTAVGERDQAFKFLNDGLKERTFEMVYLTINPEYSSLRQDDRWRRLVRKVGLAR